MSPANHFLFTPLLPSTAVGTLEFRAVQEPVRTIERLGEYYQAKARGIDVEARTVLCEDIFTGDKFDLSYDYLVVAAGSKTNTFGTPGVEESESVHFLKHLYHARRIRNRIIECFERAISPVLTLEEKRALLRFVVVGGGATSCEFSTELADFLERDVRHWYPDLADLASLKLVEAGPHVLTNFCAEAQAHYAKHLVTHGVDVMTRTKIAAVHSDPDGGVSTATLHDGSALHFGMLVWSAGLAPVKFVENSGLKTGTHGRILVDGYLRAADRVFAIGDCAADANAPLAPTASAAEQQGAYVANILEQVRPDGTLPETLAPVHPTAMPFDFLAPLDRFFAPSPEFRYVERGKMASAGTWGGVADMTDSALTPVGGTFSGATAFASWRGAYLSKQVSIGNMVLIPMCWSAWNDRSWVLSNSRLEFAAAENRS